MTTAADSERLFKAGIAAYKASEYENAIAALKPLLRDRAYRLKAGMGLVRVYMSQKDWNAARQLCQKIAQSSQPSVQQWSQETLAKIEKRRSKSTSASERSIHHASNGQPSKELSGFVPLSDADLPPAAGRKDPDEALPIASSGFTPIDKAPYKDRSSKAISSQSTKSKKVAVKTTRVTSSIFHYANLNRAVEAEQADRPTESTVEDRSQFAVLASVVASPETSVQTEWAYAERLEQGRSLGRIRTGKLWISQIVCAVGFYFLALALLNGAISLLDGYLEFLSELPLLGWVPRLPIDDATWLLLTVLVIFAIASPWLWDIWLRFVTNRKPLSLSTLRSLSAESAAVISQRCRQRRWPFPKLWKLSTDVPLIFSYGWLPRTARLVISQGLIEQLEADELAVLIAYEMAQWKSLYWPVLSIGTLILQLFHQAYWQLALWGNRQRNLLNLTAGVLSSLSYCVFWLLRLPLLWVARVRTYYGDRQACELTGNPNGLIRALAKVSFGLARAVEAQGYTPVMVESAELLFPAMPDLARYQLYGRYPLGELYAWDSLNSVRGWMSLPDAQPPLGDRIALIAAYARHWKLDAELSLPTSLESSHRKRRQRGLQKQDWLRLSSQGTPYIALVIGLALGLCFWGLGAIGHWLEWPFFDWMHQDEGLFLCSVLLSTGVGIILRINRFFPDLSFERPLSIDWPHWLSEPELLPVESIPTHLSGTLFGRPGLANWLGQDLLLKTNDGLLKLHFFSPVGPFGNFLRLGERPALPIGRSVQLLGWFRRGNRPWVDIDKVRLSNGLVVSAAHPLFSLAIATLFSGLGLWLLLTSG